MIYPSSSPSQSLSSSDTAVPLPNSRVMRPLCHDFFSSGPRDAASVNNINSQKDGTPFASLPRLGVCGVLLSSTWPKPQSQQHQCGANSCPCFRCIWMLFGYPRRGGRITYICRQAMDDGPPRLRAGMCTSGRFHILAALAVSIIIRRTRFAVDSLCIIQDSKG